MTDIKFDPKELLWEQKYRPQTIDDCVLPPTTMKYFKDTIARDKLQNLLLSSYCPGTGKTTVARSLLNDMDYDYIFKAAGTGAGEGGIQAMRDIADYASCLAISGKKKAVIIDEADNLTADAQSSLRNIIEKYSKSIRFILTCNYPEKLTGPLKSRLKEFVFEIKESDAVSIKKQMIKRCIRICKSENVEIKEMKALAAIVNFNYPDNRAVIVSLSAHAQDGVIDEGVFATLTDGADITPVMDALKIQDFKALRQLAPQYKHAAGKLLTSLYKKGYNSVTNESKVEFIRILGEFNRSMQDCADVEVEIAYTFVYLMMECKFQ